MAQHRRRTCRGSARRTKTAVSHAQAVLRLGRAAHMAACPVDCRLDDPSARLAQVDGGRHGDGPIRVDQTWHRAGRTPGRRSHHPENRRRAVRTLGLFTRFFAAAITIEMAVIVYHHVGKGFGWGGGGYEYPLMWGLMMLAIALRGGGAWSLDRTIGKQL